MTRYVKTTPYRGRNRIPVDEAVVEIEDGGSGGGSISVTDGTTTVDPATSLRLPQVADLGSGIASSGGPVPSAALVICECNSPPVSGDPGGTLAHTFAWDAFYDQTGTQIGTGGPSDAAVISALAVLGLSVDSAGQVFTVKPGGAGLYAFHFLGTLVEGGPTSLPNLVVIRSVSSPAGGISGNTGPGIVVPPGTTKAAQTEVMQAFTDALIDDNTFQVDAQCQTSDPGEAFIAYATLGIVRVR